MARPALHVTEKPIDTTRLPDALVAGTALLILLVRRGIIEQIAQRIRIGRQGGYCALDVVLYLFLYFTSGLCGGLRGFWSKVLSRHHSAIAAIAGRRSLPTPASLSRALGRVENDLIRHSASWLLQNIPDIDDLLRHPAVQTIDANGLPWHVIDYDPTNTVLRQRGLPYDDDLPTPRRQADDIAAPGHTGRKRGNMVFRKNVAQHAGSGLWLHTHLSPGNGQSTQDLTLALETVGQTFDRIGHPREHTLVRFDGEFGYLPDFTACREHHQPFIGRLNRSKLCDDPAFLARLRAATWQQVPDSRSGPRRATADLGEWTLKPGKQTRRPDGSRYEPLTVRIVASIFPPASDKANRGRLLDGWQLELFAADVPAASWPAPEVVSTYFGRGGTQENRFAQEDRELGLDRVFSYHLPGQELACLIGLMVWNLRVVMGFEAAPPPAERPAPSPRQSQVDARVPANWPRDPQVVAALGEAELGRSVEKKPGWSFEASTGTVLCGAGRELEVTTVRKVEHVPGRTGVIFRRPAGGCEDCGVRSDCLKSHRAGAHKHAEFAISSAVAERIRSRLSAVRSTSPPPMVSPEGPWAVSSPLFLPAMARQVFAERFAQSSLWLAVKQPPPPPPRPRLLAADEADRQRRRKTWTQNVDRYASMDKTHVHIEIAGSSSFRNMIHESTQQRVHFAGSG